MIELTTEFSSWYLLGCAVLAGLYAFLLYGYNSATSELSQWEIRVLTGLRFLSVFIISALLVNFLFQKWITQTEPPKIVIIQDVSESILNGEDSTYYQTQYKNEMGELQSHLAQNYEVNFLTFGKNVSVSDTGFVFDEKRTNYANVFDEIDARFAGTNLVGVIFASDGLYNVGANPAYYSFKEKYPIYTIGLGDTTRKSDISIQNVLTNDIVYLGNKFPVEISVTSELLKGKSVKLEVLNNGEVIESSVLKINSNHQLFTKKFIFNAKNEGTQRYVIRVTKFDNERNKKNNTAQALIDVIDNRDRVLIVANSPHPDVAAIKSVLNTKESLDVEVVFAENFDADLNLYNLVITHGFGTQKYNAIWRKIYKAKIPVWNIVYGNSSMSDLQEYPHQFVSSGKSGKPNRVYGSINPDFFLFKLANTTKAFIRSAPPLNAPFADFEEVDKSKELLVQKIGSVETDMPLLYFENRTDTKTAWLFGEGLWRWRIYDFQQSQNHEQFNEFIWKTIQYLSVKEDKSRFRVKVNKRFLENEDIYFKAELYNKSYELVNEEKVSLTVTNEADQEYSYVFNPSGNGYGLNVGKLPSGIYNYVAEVSSGVGNFKKSGVFIVQMVNVEYAKSAANFDVLQQLSNRTNGLFVTPNNLAELQQVFDDTSKFPSITYSSEKKQSLFHEKWLFILILSLLSFEWLIRKYKGRY
tara:strand:+ start:39291 stop:41375 length:2085 start_codon:yes stop_codon:yes gene_type:complete